MAGQTPDKEASRAENAGAARLADVGYRSAVEELCKVQGATHHTLHGKIQELAATGLRWSGPTWTSSPR
ncbi:hypothetical protein PV396_41625 [Streptomyces sp. ME02-8801-2C]|uniref:DUF4145 domain-containing protein n=1 Tax=Streptomyces sp. ME02-8801-2C TaxID=3028680 RepID=UPI0029A41622|nr:hypothetical protein [Streptomyces sp. ME02-8801-2C]MDX3458366.1 hypothetical protein [Streptomyces sp. ME02-8801-2C]